MVVLCSEADSLLCSAAVHTMAELKLSGNHLKGSRPVLSFDKVTLLLLLSLPWAFPVHSLLWPALSAAKYFQPL